jgi:hypothetical protein
MLSPSKYCLSAKHLNDNIIPFYSNMLQNSVLMQHNCQRCHNVHDLLKAQEAPKIFAACMPVTIFLGLIKSVADIQHPLSCASLPSS